MRRFSATGPPEAHCSRRVGWLGATPFGKGDLTLFPSHPRRLSRASAAPGHLANRLARVLPGLALLAIVSLLFSAGCTAGSLYSTTVWAAPVFLDDDTVALGTETGHIVIGDITTGVEQGRCLTGEGRNGVRAIYGTPAINDGAIYAGGFDGILYAVRPAALLPNSKADCSPYFQADSAIVGGPVITPEGTLLFGTEGGTLYALDISSGRAQWTFAAEDGIWGTPVLGDGLVYVGDLNGVLYAVRLGGAAGTAGTEAWRHVAGAAIGAVTLADSVIYVGAFDRNLYALNASTGAPVWQTPFTAENWFWAAPMVLDGRVFAPSLDHNLYILSAATGHLITDPVITGGAIRSEPALVGDRIIVANEEGETWWIDPVTGSGIVGGKLPAAMYSPIVPYGEDAALFFAQDGVLYRASPSLRQPIRVFPLG